MNNRSFHYQAFSLWLLINNMANVGAFMYPSVNLKVSRRGSFLSMSKDSDRARMEKTLEDMMGNDWRVFRARLVAQEQIEASEASAVTNEINHSNKLDEKQVRQEKFGNLFSAIFNNGQKQDQDKKNKGGKSNIFDGDTVGGASSSALIPPTCQDPFLSPEEVPVLLQPKVKINAHRWAHALTHIEPGCILIANEKLGGVFHQTVVLIIEHNDANGSTGIVINRPLSGNLMKVANETPSNVDLSLKMAFHNSLVSYGGPVMPEEYSILHSFGEVEGAKKIAPGIFVGGSEELMNAVRRCKMDPHDALFVKGHAAWVPNQLNREVSKGVWYVASCSKDFILRYAGAPISEEDNEADLWSDILTCMGGTYAELAKQHASKGDKRLAP